MKCIRVKLSDRREVPETGASRLGSPRHYCQRRLANSLLDEQDWLKRYSPERYHLDMYREEDDVRSDSPSSEDGSEIFKISTTKNVFCPAFLTINNLDFPAESSADLKTWSKKRARYKMVPKNCSANLHRMFVKSELVSEEMSRASSRASTEYDCCEYEEYLREYRTGDDSSDCSMLGSDRQEDLSLSEISNNNDSDFANKNEFSLNSDVCEASETSERRLREIDESIANHKREKRKSLTLSRIPSPETVQVIRIDVITGYPVSSDNSILSEVTENDKVTSENESLISFVKPLMYQREVILHSHATQTDFAETTQGDFNRIRARYYLQCERLLNCRSVNLTDRSGNK